MGKATNKVEVTASKRTKIEGEIIHPAVAVFLRGRGGQKARPTAQDFTLGENAIANSKQFA